MGAQNALDGNPAYRFTFDDTGTQDFIGLVFANNSADADREGPLQADDSVDNLR
jgi:hypothetical protein